MKIICDWENCNEVGSYKAPLKRTIAKVQVTLFGAHKSL